MPRAAARVTNSGEYELTSRQLMGVPESRSSDLGLAPFQRAGTQADGGATEASNGIAERSATQGAVRSIILLLYRGAWEDGR
jgi:hypothetical protein